MGAAGRDFHDFNVYFRMRGEYEVVAFTASQIPGIANRVYPPSLAGPLYPRGIPILPEEELAELVKREGVELVVLAYSDLSHEEVMHKASLTLASGADFMLLGPGSTMLRSRLPVVAVTGTKTGVGKSTVARYVARLLREAGRRYVIIRHPMAYGNLSMQRAQRFASHEDLDRYHCTIEEREEYEPHIEAGSIVYAGVDYEEVLRLAEEEAEVLLFDGGNNDLPFIRPDLHIVVTDALRPGLEDSHHPGEANVRMADIVVINKSTEAPPGSIERIRASIARLNPRARVMLTGSIVSCSDPEAMRGRRVVVIEDGPSVTHGGMSVSLGYIAAERGGAEIVDPRPFAVGSIKRAYEEYPHIGPVVPSLGYSEEQVRDLEATLRGVPSEAVVSATPINISRLLRIDKPIIIVRYELDDLGDDSIRDSIRELMRGSGLS